MVQRGRKRDNLCRDIIAEHAQVNDLASERAPAHCALAHTNRRRFNQQQFFELPRNVFVEVPASADGEGLRTPKLKLPESVLPLLQRMARLNDAVLRAARWRRRDLFDEVVDLDPTITDKDPAKATLAQLLPDRTGVLSASA